MINHYESKSDDSTSKTPAVMGLFLTTAAVTSMGFLSNIEDIELPDQGRFYSEYVSKSEQVTAESFPEELQDIDREELTETEREIQAISSFIDYIAKNSSPPGPEERDVLNKNFAELV